MVFIHGGDEAEWEDEGGKVDLVLEVRDLLGVVLILVVVLALAVVHADTASSMLMMPSLDVAAYQRPRVVRVEEEQKLFNAPLESWIAALNARPAIVRGGGGGQPSVLRVENRHPCGSRHHRRGDRRMRVLCNGQADGGQRLVHHRWSGIVLDASSEGVSGHRLLVEEIKLLRTVVDRLTHGKNGGARCIGEAIERARVVHASLTGYRGGIVGIVGEGVCAR
mmetsp:Transcript_48422/g.126568  ORF Transcript_48422/g.126568 Transcript_48422/m.126568 type:complete len:222 (-) Transcript_48422:173-838(-)